MSSRQCENGFVLPEFCFVATRETKHDRPACETPLLRNWFKAEPAYEGL
jgi:hypothetical protein